MGQNPPPLIAGGGVITVRESGVRVLNAALLIDPSASQPAYYGKRHLVMFGEYILFSITFRISKHCWSRADGDG